MQCSFFIAVIFRPSAKEKGQANYSCPVKENIQMISHSSIKSSISFINPPASQISQKMPYIKQLIKLGISPFLGIFNHYSNQPAGRCGAMPRKIQFRRPRLHCAEKSWEKFPLQAKALSPRTAPARAFSWADQALNQQAAPKRQPQKIKLKIYK